MKHSCFVLLFQRHINKILNPWAVILLPLAVAKDIKILSLFENNMADAMEGEIHLPMWVFSVYMQFLFTRNKQGRKLRK